MSNGWPTKPLGELLSFLTSGSRGWAEHYRESGDLFLRIQNVGRNRMLLDDVAFVAAPNTTEARRTLVQSGDVLLSITADLGRTGVVPDGIGRAFINQHLAILRVQNIHSPFLSAYLASPEGQKQVMGRNKHAVKAGLNFEDIRSFRIPMPPLAEQRRIAEVLDRTEALRTKRRATLAQLDALAQSLFLDLFGDPISNPKGWPKKSLGDVARGKPNNGIFRKNPEYLQEGSAGLPVVWLEEIFRGDSIDTKDSRRVIAVGSEVEKYGLKTGDILFCRSSLKLDGIAFNNVYLGKDDEALFECHVIRISPDLTIVSPVFLNSMLRLPQMRAIAKSKSKTATMTTIDQQSLCSIELTLPPVKLQHEFAGRISAVEKLKVAHRASLAELDALFATLQNRAFNGEL